MSEDLQLGEALGQRKADKVHPRFGWMPSFIPKKNGGFILPESDTVEAKQTQSMTATSLMVLFVLTPAKIVHLAKCKSAFISGHDLCWCPFEN
jgi:hypothetical protein